MSYLPSEETGYFEAIQVYYTALTDRLAIFGARDRVLLEQWKDEGRPARLVCRGIGEAVASCEDAPPRSLARCERFVDEQWERYRESRVGRHDASEEVSDEQGGRGAEADEPGDGEGEGEGEGSGTSTLYDQVQRAIEEAGKAADEERWRQAYRRAWRKLEEVDERSKRFGYREVDAVDRALVDAYLDALRDEERRIVEEAVATAGAGLLEGMSSTAREEHLRIKRKQALVKNFELLDVVEVIS